MFGSFNLDQSLQIIVILLISVTLHELAHAITADRLGDPTPRRNGQLTLNPAAHIDQFAMLFMVIAALAGFLFAFGRTYVNPQNLKFGPQRGGAIVAAAGPLTNLAIALVLGLFLRLNEAHGCNLFPLSANETVNAANFIFLAIEANLILFLFNLIPIPPLDGFTILSGFLTPRQLYAIAPMVQYAPYLLLILVLVSFQTNFFTNDIFAPVLERFQSWILLPATLC